MGDRFEQGFLRDEERNLVVISGGDGVTGVMDYGFLRDEATRALVVVGPNGESIGGGGAKGLEEELESSGVGFAKYDPEAEIWEARPKGFARVVFVSPVHGAPDPSDAQDFDEKVEPSI